MNWRRLWPYALAVAALAVLVAVGPAVVRLVGDPQQGNDAVSFDAQPTTSADDASNPVDASGSTPESAPPTTAGTTPTSTPTTVPSVASSIPVPPTVAAPATPALAVYEIQVVPPVRDFVLRIDGTALTTDRNGVIRVDPATDPLASVEVVGLIANPPLQSTVTMGWSDGVTESTRTLASMADPVVQLAISVSNRVTVAVEPAPAAPATVTFVSKAGSVELTTDTPEWVVDQRAVRDADGAISVERVTYTPSSVAVDGQATTAPLPATFTATPEALWTVGR